MLSLFSTSSGLVTGPVIAPRAAPAMRSAVQMAFSWDSPSGQVWDPIGLIKKPEKFERLRYVEVKQ